MQIPGRRLDVKDTTFSGLLNNDSPFVVPRFQRAFAWEADQIDEFVQDISELHTAFLNNTMKKSEIPFQYFGAVVLVSENQGFSIVDGQQRLTTFTLTFRAIERELRLIKEDPDCLDAATSARAGYQAKEIRERYITREVLEGAQMNTVHRLRLSRRDEGYFKSLIDSDQIENAPSPTDRDSWQRMFDAAKMIRDQLVQATRFDPGGSPTSHTQRLEALEALREAIETHIRVVNVITDSRDEAHRIFRVLNDRGKSLSDADLLRTQCLETLWESDVDEKIQEKVADIWDRLLKRDMGYMDKYLAAYYPSMVGKRVPTKKVVDVFAEKWIKGKTTDEIVKFSENLRNDEIRFRAICSGEWPYENSTLGDWEKKRVIRLVDLLAHEACFPLLLAGACKLNESEFAPLVHLVSVFAFRYKIICGGHIGGPSRTYYETARDIRSGNFSMDDLKQKFQDHIDKNADDTHFQESLQRELNYSRTAARKPIRFFLTGIEEYWGALRANAPGAGPIVPSKEVVLDVKTLDIEHIYPSEAKVKDPAMEDRKDSIENLMFWRSGDNRAAQNDLFPKKKAKYLASGCHMTNSIGSEPAWDSQAADDRRDQLMEDALRVFAVEPS